MPFSAVSYFRDRNGSDSLNLRAERQGIEITPLPSFLSIRLMRKLRPKISGDYKFIRFTSKKINPIFKKMTLIRIVKTTLPLMKIVILSFKLCVPVCPLGIT